MIDPILRPIVTRLLAGNGDFNEGCKFIDALCPAVQIYIPQLDRTAADDYRDNYDRIFKKD